MHKPQRWYEIKDGLLYVYGSPNGKSEFCSICQISDLKFYRANFTLRKVWTTTE